MLNSCAWSVEQLPTIQQHYVFGRNPHAAHAGANTDKTDEFRLSHTSIQTHMHQMRRYTSVLSGMVARIIRHMYTYPLAAFL